MNSCRGRLVALEGTDGCGKTTQAGILAARLGAVLTREPGGTPLGECLRKLLLSSGGPAVGPAAEALLMLASRAQHVADVVAPALEAGKWVVTDRFSASTLAYQGYGRGLGLGELRLLTSWSSGGLWPDLNVLLVREGAGLGCAADHAPDRMEAEGSGFQDRVAAGFRELAAADPPRWAVVDGEGTVEAVAARVEAAVVDRLGQLPPAGSPEPEL
ncbi:MAG: dTMP kinase [Acidimicrobiales bacterium]